MIKRLGGTIMEDYDNLTLSEGRVIVQEQVEIIYESLRVIKDVLRAVAPEELRRAESYWLAHIDGALENRGGYIGGSFIIYEDTMKALEEYDDWREEE
jgi:hypothetical protein